MVADRLGRGRASMLGGNNRSCPKVDANEHMDPLCIVAGVRKQRSNRHTPEGLGKDGIEIAKVGARAEFGASGEHQMRVAIAQQSQLRKMPIRQAMLFFPEFPTLLAALHEIAAGMLRFKAAAVDGGQVHTLFDQFELLPSDERLIEQSLHATALQEALRGL